MSRAHILAGLIFLVTAASSTTAAIFVRIPGVPGDVKAAGYDDGTWSVVRAGTYGVDRSLEDSGKGGTEDINIGVGKLLPIGVVMDFGIAAPSLMQFAINGNALDVVEMHAVDLVDDRLELRSIILLERAFVKRCALNGFRNGRALIDAEFFYNKISITNRVTDPSNPKRTIDTRTTWDVVKGVGSYEEGQLNAPPVVTMASSIAFPEGGSVRVPIRLRDPDGPAAGISLSASSANTVLIPDDHITFEGEGDSRIMRLRGAAGQSGIVQVTVMARESGNDVRKVITVTVRPGNRVPQIAAIDKQDTEPGVATFVTLSISDADHPVADLTVEATSDNPTLVPGTGLVPLFENGHWTLQVRPVEGQTGMASITVRATDPAGASSEAAFILEVASKENRPPGNIVLEPSRVAENSPEGTVVGSLTAQDPDGDTPLSFRMVPADHPLFKLDGDTIVVREGAVLNFEAKASERVTVIVTDSRNASSHRELDISLVNVNEAPNVRIGAAQSIPSGELVSLPRVIVTDPDAGTNEVEVRLSVMHGAIHLNAGELTVSGNGTGRVTVRGVQGLLHGVLATLQYRSNEGYGGPESLMVTADDLGHSGAGEAQQGSAAVAFVVEGANDPVEDWRRDHFTAEQWSDPKVGGLFGDADGDGLVNLAEYKRGKDPFKKDSDDDLEVKVMEVEGDRYLQISFDRLPDAVDPRTTMQVEIATDLSAWKSGEAVLSVIEVKALENGLERVTMQAEVAQSVEPKQFLRFVFSRR